MFFQETRESLKKIHKPVTDLRSVGLLSWLASEYAHGSKKEMDRSKRLWKTVPQRYHKIQRTVV